MGLMSRFPGGIERRIFHAVLLVLGACDRSLDAQSPTQPVVEQPPPQDEVAVESGPRFATPPEDTETRTASDPDTTVDTTVDTTGVPDTTAAPAPDPASALCASYKKSARIDKRKAKQPKFATHGNVRDSVFWDTASNVARCTIVHERSPATVTVMHQYHWCPQGGGTRPPPVPVQVQGERVLVQRVAIRGDGKVLESKLEWASFGMVNERLHNCGRRFEGLELAATSCDEPGAQLAAMAELEAASVPAFDRLARELAMWGAPSELVERARRAMRDEVRHARVMTALARQHGHTPRAIAVPPLPCRSLAAIAHENAIEGCVREAYGALVATFQAERARPALRRAFQAIAIDERAHAELAEDVHAWILGRLDAASREAVERARELAELELRASLASSRPCHELGLPNGAEAVALCDAYFAAA